MANFAFCNGTLATPNPFSSEPAMLRAGSNTAGLSAARVASKIALYTRPLSGGTAAFGMVTQPLASDWLEPQSKLQLSACTRLISSERDYEFGRQTSTTRLWTALASRDRRTRLRR